MIIKDDSFNWNSDLPPEMHLKMALDFLFVRAKKINLPFTATLIEAASQSANDELLSKRKAVYDKSGIKVAE